MKKFIIRILVVIALFYAGLYIIQYFYDDNLKNADDLDFKIWNEVAEGTVNADLIFVGSSRTLVHYNPIYFEKGLDVSSYVLGLDGTGYDVQPVLTDLYLKENKAPKIIVQNVDIASFSRTTNFHLSPYLPYLTFGTARILNEVYDKAYLDFFIPMYKYRTHIFNKNNLFLNKQPPAYRGYIEKRLDWDGSFEKQIEELDSEKFDLSHIDFEKGYKNIEKLIEKSLMLDIRLVLIWAPEYYERIPYEEPYFSDVQNRFRSMANRHEHVTFFDFSKDSLTFNKSLFYNSYHLNNKGVEVFNRNLIDSLKLNLLLNP